MVEAANHRPDKGQWCVNGLSEAGGALVWRKMVGVVVEHPHHGLCFGLISQVGTLLPSEVIEHVRSI